MRKLLLALTLTLPLHLAAFDNYEDDYFSEDNFYSEDNYFSEDNFYSEDNCCSENNCCPRFSWSSCCDWCSNFDICTGWNIEGRVAAYKPLGKRFRKIYGNWGTNYEIEVSKQICGPVLGWVNFSYFSKKGHSLGFDNSTRVRIFPLSFGVKYLYELNCDWSMYGGVGIAFSWLDIHDDSPFVKEHVHKQTVGFVLKYGVRRLFCDRYFADIFADYIYQRFGGTHHHCVRSHNANCSAIKIGGGLGFCF